MPPECARLFFLWSLTSTSQAGILSVTAELNTGHGFTVFWAGQDFLMARPTQRHACKIRCLANLCRLSCVQRETSNWFQNFPRTYSSVKRQHFLSEVEVSLLNSFKEESSQKSTKWDNCMDLLHKRHGSCCKTTQSSLTKCLPVSVKPKYLLQFTKYLFQLKSVFSKWHVQWLVAGVHNLKEVSISIIRRFQSMRLLQITKYLFQKKLFFFKMTCAMIGCTCWKKSQSA